MTDPIVPPAAPVLDHTPTHTEPQTADLQHDEGHHDAPSAEALVAPTAPPAELPVPVPSAEALVALANPLAGETKSSTPEAPPYPTVPPVAPAAPFKATPRPANTGTGAGKPTDLAKAVVAKAPVAVPVAIVRPQAGVAPVVLPTTPQRMAARRALTLASKVPAVVAQAAPIANPVAPKAAAKAIPIAKPVAQPKK